VYALSLSLCSAGPDVKQKTALMAEAAAASHAARLAELNVAPEVIAAVPGCTREPPVTGGVRVMSWNILAEGMSYDGFHVPTSWSR